MAKDQSQQDDIEKAARRMKRIVATPEEVALYKYAPNQARDNDNPGIPCDHYGTMMDD